MKMERHYALYVREDKWETLARKLSYKASTSLVVGPEPSELELGGRPTHRIIYLHSTLTRPRLVRWLLRKHPNSVAHVWGNAHNSVSDQGRVTAAWLMKGKAADANLFAEQLVEPVVTKAIGVGDLSAMQALLPTLPDGHQSFRLRRAIHVLSTVPEDASPNAEGGK